MKPALEIGLVFLCHLLLNISFEQEGIKKSIEVFFIFPHQAQASACAHNANQVHKVDRKV